MRLEWKKVESLEMPLEVDKNLTTSGVYYRKDIEQVEDKYIYDEVLLSNDFRFDIEDTQEYINAIKNKIDSINAQLHITKLDFFTYLCQPAGISYNTLIAKVSELGMDAQWNLCNHIYYGVIKPFLSALPLGKTEEEIIEIFEKHTNPFTAEEV